jgi:hypothetical protein
MGLKYFNNKNSGDLDIAEVKYDSFGKRTGEFSIIGGNVSALEPGNGYMYHTFTSPGYLETTYSSKNVEILLVGGGGGSGSWGGGGAGGLLYHDSLILTNNVYTITIGSGGIGADVSSAAPGNDTTFVGPTFTATAKGGGAGSAGTGQGGSMGSVFGTPTGWGTWSPTDTAIQPTQPQPGVPAGYLQYGFKCGNGAYYSMGGGGGAGAAGPNATASAYTNGTNTPTPGGVGRQYPQFVGSLIGVPSLSPHNGYFAGGGGSGSGRDGWVNNAGTNTVGTGGLGGGGNGGAHNGGSAIDNHTAGSTNTGGGGGGASSFPQSLPGKSGGSGIVIIRYLL